MRKRFVSIFAAAILLGGCSYSVGYSFEIGTQGEVKTVGLEIGMGEDAVDMLSDSMGPDDEDTLMYGAINQESMSDVRFHELVVANVSVDELFGEQADVRIGSIETRRWIENGTRFFSLTIAPEGADSGDLGRSMGFSTVVNPDGSVLATVNTTTLAEDAASLGSRTSENGGPDEETLSSMLEITITVDMIMPYGIVDTNGTLDPDNDRVVHWSEPSSFGLPEVLYAETAAPDRGIPWANCGRCGGCPTGRDSNDPGCEQKKGV